MASNRSSCPRASSQLTSAEVRRDLITATAALAGMATFVFGALTNLPVALAYEPPSIFCKRTSANGSTLVQEWASTPISLSRSVCLARIIRISVPDRRKVVGVNGNGVMSYQTALTAVFFEGLIFILLALTGMRQWLVKLIPATIKTATGVGIGFFLTEIGLSYSAGIGAITGGGVSTPLALGGCPPGMIDEDTGMCKGSQVSNPKVRCPNSQRSCVVIDLFADVGCHYVWWDIHVCSHGIPSQICSRYGNRFRLRDLMAVSRLNWATFVRT